MFRNWCLVQGQEKVPWPGDPLQSGQRWDLQELEGKAQLRMLCGGIRCGCFKKLEKGIIQGKKNLLFTLSVNANQCSKHKGCRIRQCQGSLMLSTKI